MTTNKSGFTIIEVLIVVAILGILAAIAIPSYTKYITSSRRADGQVALLEAAQIMERYFTNNNTYVGATIGDGTTDLIPESSEKEYYLLSFPGDDNPSSRAFTIRATAQNEQSSDADCEYLEIDQLGRKTSHPSDNCW